MPYRREELRARLLAAIGTEDEYPDRELYDEMLAVIAAGKENLEEAPVIVDVFLDRLETRAAQGEMEEFFSPPSGRRGVQLLVAMFLVTLVLAFAIFFVVPPLIMVAVAILVFLFTGGLNWLVNWYGEVRRVRQEQIWLTGDRPLVVVRTYTKDSAFARDASRMRLLGYDLSTQQRVFGGDKVTYELRKD